MRFSVFTPQLMRAIFSAEMGSRNKYRGLKQNVGLWKKHHERRAAAEAALESAAQAQARAAAAFARRSAAATRAAGTRARHRLEASAALQRMSEVGQPAQQAPPNLSGDEAVKRVRALLEDGRKTCALLVAAELGLPVFVSALCKDDSVDTNAISASNGMTALLYVCRASPQWSALRESARAAAVKALLAAGARKNACCANGVSALSYAQQAGCGGLIALLQG